MAFVQDVYQTLFFAKREISFEVSTFGGLLSLEGSLFPGFAETCDILSLLSLLSRGCYFRNFTVTQNVLIIRDPTKQISDSFTC